MNIAFSLQHAAIACDISLVNMDETTAQSFAASP
jgi:hypothetical protein